MKKCQIEYFKEKKYNDKLFILFYHDIYDIISYCYTGKENFYNLYLSFVYQNCMLSDLFH